MHVKRPIWATGPPFPPCVFAKVAHPAVTGGVTLTYDPNSNGGFEGLDRLGRVIDQKWVNEW